MAIVYSIVRRHMKRTSQNAFTVFDGSTDLPVTLSLEPDEAIVGWYRNPVPWEHFLIIFTSEAIYLAEDGKLDRIAVADIVGYELPKSESEVTGIRVLTKDGFRFVRVAGRFGPNGNQRDAYSFLMVVSALAPRKAVVHFEGGGTSEGKH